MTNIVYLSACDLAEKIRNKLVSCKEVVTAHLERIEQVNPKLNAVVTLDADKAIDNAVAADTMVLKGKAVGPLHGVPMTVKDSIDTKDLVSTWGTVGRKDLTPKEDATVVTRAKQAGVIVLGKTNTPELTLGIEMTNDVFGPTFNPFHLSKSPGGSSGGAAAILAAGGIPLEFGSDTGGSIREPANYCGVCGLKPSFGRVPRTGHAGPWELDIWDQLTQIGPMARCVDDLELLLNVIHGEDGIDPTAVTRPLKSSHKVELKDLRIAYYTDADVLEPIAEIENAIVDATKALKRRVSSVQPNYPEILKSVSDLYIRYTYSYLERFLVKTLDYYGTDEPAPNLRHLLENIKRSDKSKLGEINLEVNDFRAHMGEFMRNYDIIICPANVSTAVSHSNQPTDYDHNTWFNLYAYNLTGWPAAVVPVGLTDKGLPYGIQIVGKPWCEDQVLAMAKYLEQLFGGFKPPKL